jgi:penicillin-binding protein 1A
LSKNKYRLKICLFYLTFFFLLIGLIITIITYYYLPNVDKLKNQTSHSLISLYDNKEELFYVSGHNGNNYAYYNQFPKHLVDALISIEDIRFFKHFGVDLIALPRAVIKNVSSGRYIEGASTISQQLAKMLFLTPKKTLIRKYKEILLAIKIEQNYSKEEIIEMYLNKAYYGSGNYGIIAASRDYFEKEVSQLSLNEAALLMGLLKAPSKYSPKVNATLSKNRTKIVLQQMLKYNFINIEESVIAEYQGDLWSNYSLNTDNYKYFSDMVRKEIKQYSDIFPFNLKVSTSFDQKIHNIIDQEVSSFYKHKAHLKSVELSIIAMRPNGAIMSMLGGKNYKHSQYNRALYAKRQTGSAFKLFVYLAAIENGYKTTDYVIDQEIEVAGWKPQNYDHKYRGYMTLRESFVRSINSVAVNLGQEVGIDKVISMAKKMGVKSTLPKISSLSLGTAELSLLEMVAAYGVILNNGYKVNPYNISYITDDYDNVLYQAPKPVKVKVLEQEVVENISDLLHGVVIWGTGKRANLHDKYIRGKTGTSQNYRDAWFIGFSKDLVIGIWMGNDKNKIMDKVTGGGYPAEIFHNIMNRVE